MHVADLNLDQWQTLTVNVDQVKGQLRATLGQAGEPEVTSTFRSASVQGQERGGSSSDSESKLTSILYVGGGEEIGQIRIYVQYL